MLPTLQFLVGSLSDHSLLSRLVFTSLELALLALAVAAAIRVFGIGTPRVRALLWLLVLAKPLVGLTLGPALPFLAFERRAPQEIAAPSTLSAEAQTSILAERARLERELARVDALLAPRAPGREAEQPVGAAAAANPLPARGSALPWAAAHLLDGVVVLWWFGVVFMLGLLGRDIVRVRRLRERSSAPGDDLACRYRRIVGEMGLSRCPDLRITDGLHSPALVGVLRPFVALPRWAAEEGDSGRVEWLLRHELAHWRNRDHLGLALRQLANALFFFHPAVWWAGRRWEEAMELACDRALLERDADARRYARELFAVLEHHCAIHRPAAAGLFATRTQIGRRIEALLANPLRFPARLRVPAVIGIAVLAVFVLATGVRFASGAEEEPAPPAVLEPEQSLRERIAEARAALRSLAVVMEAYWIDHARYPENLDQLTSPISYLASVPADPFTDSASPETLRFGYGEDWKGVLYSVGPDGVDDGGRVVYDPATGAGGRGDIVRQLDAAPLLEFADPRANAALKEAERAKALVLTAVEAWFCDHRTLPPSLQALVSPEPYLLQVPEDPFAPGRPARYRLDRENGIAWIYSVGPDGDDDGARPMPGGRFGDGRQADGDVRYEVRESDLAQRLPNDMTLEAVLAREPGDALLHKLVELRQAEGRDNAMIHYVLATKRDLSLDYHNLVSDLVGETMRGGWREEADALLPLIRAWRPVFELVRDGAALDYARKPGAFQGYETPAPNYLRIQIVSKLLCAEGRWLASQGRASEALDDYLTVLTMGRDFTRPQAMLISQLVGVSIQAMAAECMHDLARSGALGEAELARALERLETVERTQGLAADALAVEEQCGKLFLQDLLPLAPDERRQKMNPLGADEADVVEFLVRYADVVDAYESRFWGVILDYVRTPYWERDRTAHQAAVERAAHPTMDDLRPLLPEGRSLSPEDLAALSKMFSLFGNFEETDVRSLVALAKLRLALIATALEAYRQAAGVYPGSLRDLSPDTLDAVPLDPFTGNLPAYHVAGDGSGYRLYSLGPDMEDQGALELYDPKNGVTSGGDILL